MELQQPGMQDGLIRHGLGCVPGCNARPAKAGEVNNSAAHCRAQALAGDALLTVGS